ncbi:hypothetical protein [Microbacterium sp. SORGH_AS_0888]|uniref:hypothetical protein n=1 Tax=Microbacterium sp. SORGH_AS_0888 TaxID=3041791 RepID=UPI002780E0BD|nr:hypothetical protein [Microbacterium sp. SORGH_AS_0888]MDQ1128308.1 hypothetical protein [Microbacterium sp. SORGH_AS_0888]
MRKYLFGTGLFSAVIGGVSLLRGLRNHEEPFTWRTALAWISWGITLALAIGAIVDTFRASRGHLVAGDSPVSGDEEKLLKKRLRS